MVLFMSCVGVEYAVLLASAHISLPPLPFPHNPHNTMVEYDHCSAHIACPSPVIF